MKVSVLFPAYNEAANLRRFPSEVFPALDRLGVAHEVLVIDDGSTDATATEARAMQGRVRLVQHERNQGLGAALRTGFREARGDLVVTMDTDLAFAPALVGELLARFDRGVRLDDTALILEGPVPAAVLALLVQGLFEVLERLVVPRGLRL